MKCEYPNCDRDEDILFYCNYCHHSFCQEHRDPQMHNCPIYYGQIYMKQQGEPTPSDFIQSFVEEIKRSAQIAQERAQNAEYERFTRMDIESKKKLIEKKLIASPDLFSFGNEVIDLLFGFGLIILVFGFSQLVAKGNYWGFLISGILIGTAFLPHELAHKFVAIKKGQFARYILWIKGIMITFLTLFLGIALVVPGFVAIVPLDPRKRMTKKEIGIVAFAGPATNAIIGSFSLLIGLLYYHHLIPFFFPSMFENIFLQIALFNSLIALFNCIPVWQLDGKKILSWNKFAYFSLIILNVLIATPPFIYNITLF
ncbi:MAG: AN1-type zinc finger domain-containing protein [Candidatus Heimdallarchaeaceae archaeon]